MEQIMQMPEKKMKSLETDCKKENILHLLTRVRDMHLDEKREYLQKQEVSECSSEGECSVRKVLSKGESYGITSCTITRQRAIASVYGSIVEQAKRSKVLIQSLGCRIIHLDFFFSRVKACMNNVKSDSMTIHYYKSSAPDKRTGVPVVLNFSGTKRFLKCTYKEGKAVLTVECFEQDQMKSISNNDQTTWPFVFFLSTTKDNLHRFESATCSGWFIHTGSGLVYACNRLDQKVEENTFRIFLWNEQL